MSKKNQAPAVDELALIAIALDAIPNDLPRYEAPAFVEQHVRESGASEGAARLAKALVRYVGRAGR
jgi:hypothetical protein